MRSSGEDKGVKSGGVDPWISLYTLGVTCTSSQNVTASTSFRPPIPAFTRAIAE